MRRKDKEITDRLEMEEIIRKSQVCRLAMSDNNFPYIVPMNFGYENGIVYLHSFVDGLKIDILKRNPEVCLEFEVGTELITSENACDFGMKYKTVIVMGRVSFLEKFEEKMEALNVIVRQYSSGSFSFTKDDLKKITVMKINISQMTGKKAGYK